MKRFANTKKRSKSPEIFASPSDVVIQIQPLPNPDDADYRRKLFERLQDEELFDLMMNRCNEMSLEEAFEPIMKNYFQAKRSIVWVYDQKESNYLSHTLNRKISSSRSYLETIVSQKTVCNIPDIDDQMTCDQLLSEIGEHHLFIPLALNNGILIGVIQVSRDAEQDEFSKDEENKGIFIMKKFTIYGTCFFGAPTRVMIASNIAQISTPKKTVDTIVDTLSPIFKFKVIEFWYYKPRQEEFAKYNSETGGFQGMYKCSIGIVAQCLTKKITLNLDRCGNHSSYSSGADIDPDMPLLITTCEFDQTIWAMALRGKSDSSRYSPMDEQLAITLMPYIARSIAFSSGFSMVPSTASEQNDMLVTKLLDAASDLVSTLDLRELVRRIEEKVQSLVNATTVRLILTDHEKQQVYCDFQDDIENHKTFRYNEGLVAKVLQTQQTYRGLNPSKDQYFNKDLDIGEDLKTATSLMILPINSPEGGTIALVSCANKVGADQFNEADESAVHSLSAVVGVSLQNAITHHRALSIPSTFKHFSSKNFDKDLKLSDIQELLDDISKHAELFTPQASCSIYLNTDDDLILFRQSGTVPMLAPKYANDSLGETEYKIYITEPNIEPDTDLPRQSSRSFVSTRTAGQAKAKPLNTVFCCVPIINKENHIGVLVFTALSTGTDDEIQMIKTYVSIALTCFKDKQVEQLANLWNKKQMIKQYIEDSDKPFKVCEKLKLQTIEDIQKQENNSIEDSFKIIVSGFDLFGLFEHFTIPLTNMLMLIIEISSRYGSGYHSWNHTIETFKYLLKCLHIEELKSLEKTEIIAALVASLSIELDRPDFDSLGLVAIEALSECDGISVSSGFNAMNEIINTEECNIFVNLSNEDAKKIWNYIDQFTFATDMKKHFDIMDRFSSLNDNGEFSLEIEENRISIIELIMKCSDLHDVTKDSEFVNENKGKIADDFFKFGELFRCQGMEYNGDPSRLSLNTETSNIGFFTYIVLPLFAAVAKVIASVEPDVDALLATIGKWKEEIAKLKKEKEGENENEKKSSKKDNSDDDENENEEESGRKSSQRSRKKAQSSRTKNDGEEEEKNDAENEETESKNAPQVENDKGKEEEDEEEEEEEEDSVEDY